MRKCSDLLVSDFSVRRLRLVARSLHSSHVLSGKPQDVGVRPPRHVFLFAFTNSLLVAGAGADLVQANKLDPEVAQALENPVEMRLIHDRTADLRLPGHPSAGSSQERRRQSGR